MVFAPAVVTSTSRSSVAARRRTLDLYKTWLRSCPTIVEQHQLDLTTPVLRRRLRQEFERFRNVTDLPTIDVLLLKGRQEYEETVNMWKQKTHVMRYFEEDEYKDPTPRDFLGRFYAGV
ncbi:NADH dehydrogenase 1 alpha subcomplex subunit 6 ndufa6 [Chytridiales sp. JEL 0842]|nr:NADH dehydrogenase 1 alpha subcomplex subunit 6 ndufa6 [Chytridiales sp. JEL 0842]